MKKVLSILLPFVFAACSFGGGTESTDENPASKRLISFESCSDMVAVSRENFISDMEITIDSYNTCYTYDEEDMTATPTSVEGDSTYSTTNLQEEGVDEMDILKNDGTNIYVATELGVDIFKAFPLDEFSKIGTYAVEEGVQGMILDGSKLILLSQDSSQVNVRILNISSASSPVLIATRTLNGSLTEARYVDHVLHAALGWAPSYDIEYPEDFNDQLDLTECGSDERQAYLDTLKAENRVIIEAMSDEDFLPQHGNGTTDQAVSCDHFLSDPEFDENNFAGLWSVEISDNGVVDEKITFVRGDEEVVYASTSSFYLTATKDDADETVIHRFAINGKSDLHEYEGSGAVTGHIDNSSLVGQIQSSFSMGEKDGVLRIATTVGHVSGGDDSDVYNNLYTLDASGGDLTLIGKIENIAAGEQIYAMRFIGDNAYMITFKKIDPLFVIDVSDATNPTLLSELEMPGFSSYLQALDDEHIIGIGKDADDQGDFAWFQGLKLTTFDVSNSLSPTIADDIIIGSRGTDSEVITDHHAFTYDSDTGIMAIPLSLYTGGTGGSDYGDFQYNAVYFYDFQSDGTLDSLAEVELPTDSTTPLRTVFIEDGVYVLDSNNLYLLTGYTLEDQLELTSDVSGSFSDYYVW